MPRLSFATLALLVSTAIAAPALAQDLSFDLGLGASVDPVFPGASDHELGPWLIWRGGHQPSNPQGLSITPSFNSVGAREAADHPSLTGLDDLDRAIELGAKISYGAGPVTTYGTLRKGFGGHEGVTGEFGAKLRTDVNDRLTLWSGLEFGYGNDDYNATYFGVTPAQSAASGLSAYSASGGVSMATARLEARYQLGENTALLGEVEYGRLIGDAADSPVVQDKAQPAIRLGVTRSFSFGF